MDKIFDHRCESRGWVEVTNPAKAIRAIFAEEEFCDRDNPATYVVEHWSSETDKIIYHVAHVTGWYYGDPPEMSVSYTEKPSDIGSYWKPTHLDPRRDYILIKPLPYGMKWPPLEETNAEEAKSRR